MNTDCSPDHISYILIMFTNKSEFTKCLAPQETAVPRDPQTSPLWPSPEGGVHSRSLGGAAAQSLTGWSGATSWAPEDTGWWWRCCRLSLYVGGGPLVYLSMG